jgi:hypothetical protein
VIVTFHDLQSAGDALNGSQLGSRSAVSLLLRQLAARPPFLFELRAETRVLTIGLAGNHGCVQFSRCDGETPYLMAWAGDNERSDRFTEFLAGGTLTPISDRYRLSIEFVEQVVGDFVVSGGMSSAVQWEEI